MASDLPIEALLRGATDRAGLRELLHALGLPADGAAVTPVDAWCRLPAPAGNAAGAAGSPARCGSPPEGRAPVVVATADRGGVRALAVELAGEVTAQGVVWLARRVQARDAGRPHLLVVAGEGYRRLAFVATGLDETPRPRGVGRARPRRSDVEALEELAARDGEAGAALALRHARALERSRVSGRFFREFRAQRDAVAAAWSGVPAGETAHRRQLALLLLCRLMFLYFLQRDGHLGGDVAYVATLVARWRPGADGRSFFRAVLQPLFFGVLNTRPERRAPEARALGELPYLNGGLFERHALERAYPELDLPDGIVAAAVARLLERYRFTTQEPVEAEVAASDLPGIDPEMLGRVFEGLMASERRGATGTFFTPAAVVERLTREAMATYLAGRVGVDEARVRRVLERPDRSAGADPLRRELLEAARAARVLDPACGSGAFLVGALSRLALVRRALGEESADLRCDIVARALHGVDLQEDAALLCALRLWLTLAARPAGAAGPPGPVPPLPNLDRRIRQGDALVDPLDLVGAAAGPGGPSVDRAVRQAVRRIEPLAARYLGADPQERPQVQRELVQAEAALARAWLAGARARLERRLREARAAAAARDLFGERPAEAARAEAERASLERARAEIERLESTLETAGGLPFFSFGVHFADAALTGFDLVLSNPPWVRAHRWPAHLRRLVGRRYRVCGSAGWRGGAGAAPRASGAQVDLALLFLERSLELLAPGGVLGMVLPAKLLRSLYGSGGRRLLTEQARLVSVQDHSLDQRSVFRADAFAMLVVAEKRRAPPSGDEPVRVTMIRRRAAPLRFTVRAAELPLAPGDPDAPWLIAPPGVQRALRRMQAAGARLGEQPGVRIRRGVVTGANDVLIVRRGEDKLGGLAVIRAEGAFAAGRRTGAGEAAERYEAVVEARALARLVRGSGIGAWRYDAPESVVWVHDDATGVAGPAPARLGAYLARHAARLEARTGWRPGRPLGALFHVTPDTLRPKVAWHDLAETLNAVALPARVVTGGVLRPLVPLNTVYFVPAACDADALLLAAYLNSLPVRVFARAIAERAKDARFRFFAWVVGSIPLPADWRSDRNSRPLLELSREAHAAGRIGADAQARLDEHVARAYGLRAEDVAELARFDRWLRGEP
ncbi:MAG: hypothetical protein IRZ00_10800 [Gemmatimonadetes bacterium]|nr:hypothetical protein [Gemmatimonadota bacterium]